MNLSIRSRGLMQSAAASVSRIAPRPVSIPCFQRRTIFGINLWGKKPAGKGFNAPTNPLTEEYLKRKPTISNNKMVRGDLASSSIFEDEEIAGPKPERKKDSKDDMVRNPSIMAAALDPDPTSRKRWERKMVIREVRKRGRLTKAQMIKRQERELQLKSHNIKTSVKKLGPLARQIAGKTVEEAIVQMRFSKKKAAYEVRKHLEHARNEAIVRRGMGLGAGKAIPAQTILTNDGKRVKITNPTTLYVSQAWVGKGDFGRTPDHRARGQINIMKNPSTHIAVVLKEEATRIREHDERVQKKARRRTWTQLPNRPISGQRQYYSW